MRKTKTTLKFLFVFALTVLLALALAACGDKPEDTGTAATTTAPATTTEPPAVTEKPEYTATFLREDKTVLMEVKFRRGDTTLSTVPEVPAKDGYFGTWPEYASKMYGDFSLEAEYTSLTVPTEKGLQFELSKDGTYYTLTDGGYSAPAGQGHRGESLLREKREGRFPAREHCRDRGSVFCILQFSERDSYIHTGDESRRGRDPRNVAAGIAGSQNARYGRLLSLHIVEESDHPRDAQHGAETGVCPGGVA